MGEPLRILVVDDEKNIRTTLSVCLEGIGCTVQAVATVEAACAAHAAASFDLAFVDLRLGAGNGLELIPRLLATQRELAIVVITAFASVESAVEADAVRLPGTHDEGQFALRASGHSMEGIGKGIRDGDWLVLRLARGATLGAALGRVALIARGHPEEGRTFHLKRIAREGRGFVLESDNPEVPSAPAVAEDELLALHVRTVRPEDLGPERGAELADGAVGAAFEVGGEPVAPVSRVDGHLFVFVEGQGALAEPDRVERMVADRREAETAFVLGRVDGSRPWRHLGVGRWVEDERRWAIPEVDFATWRELGHGRGASRRLEEEWLVRARARIAEVLASPGPGGWLEGDGRRCRIVGPSAKGGVRIDGGEGGFAERTVSEVDVAWVLKAQALAGVLGRGVDEGIVNEVRYLDGTPKGSTRWIDTGWALVMVGRRQQVRV